jgi:hypothetical protein
LDTKLLPAVTKDKRIFIADLHIHPDLFGTAHISNPIDSTSRVTPPPPDRTVPACDAYHQVQVALKPLLNGLQTEEQVKELVENLKDLKYVFNAV